MTGAFDPLRNRLLAAMGPGDLDALRPHLQPVELERAALLLEPDQALDHMFFPLSGVGSVIAISEEGHEVEAGLFGRDGATPSGAILGADRSPHRIVMQIGGEALRIETALLHEAMDARRELRMLLLRFVQTAAVQTAFTALSNAIHPIDERCARWILMCHDRMDGNDIPLTHEFLSLMLAVRRPSVTTALHVLEGNRLIEADRGWIMVRDRAGLEDFARDAYGKPEAEYERLVGPLRG